LDICRTGNRDAANRRLRAPAAHPRPKRFFIARLIVFNERDADQMRTGFDREPEIQRRIARRSAATTSAPAASRSAAASDAD